MELTHIYVAEELSAKESRWADDIGFENGRMGIAPTDRYSLTPFECINRPLFNKMATDALAIYERLPKMEIETQAIAIYAFENAVLLPFGAIAVDGKFVKETLAVLPEHYYNQVMSSAQNMNASEDADEPMPLYIIEQPTILNYGHWVVEMLPKIMPMLPNILAGKAKLCVPGTPSYVSATLSYIGIRNEHLFKPQKLPLKLKKALYISPISKHSGYPGNISPWAANILSEMTSGIQSGNKKRIFVSRKDATKRRLLNEDDLFSIVEPFGYERIETAKMKFAEQVSVFRGAERVIGVFGASLTNLAFCHAGARAMVISPNYFLDHFYWNLASLSGCSYHQVLGEVSGNDYDFSVTAPDFAKAFEHFIARTQ